MSKKTVENLEALRAEMRRLKVDAVIIPGTDPHQSEYISGSLETEGLGDRIYRQ